MLLAELKKNHAVLTEALKEVESIIDQRDALARELEAIKKTISKAGYHVEQISDGVFTLERNPNPEEPNGEYTHPIPYYDDMEVTAGLFYTNGDDIWEAIKSGIPAGFNDNEFFDIID